MTVRKLLHIRQVIDSSIEPQRTLIKMMARMLGPDRLAGANIVAGSKKDPTRLSLWKLGLKKPALDILYLAGIHMVWKLCMQTEQTLLGISFQRPSARIKSGIRTIHFTPRMLDEVKQRLDELGLRLKQPEQ